MLINSYSKLIECGTDEAGRGCLAGPVTAAAVILPNDFRNTELNDSKKLSESKRNDLKKIIIEPLLMFNYLKQEEDFYKWIFNFKEYIPKLFYNMINLNNNDYKKLSKILFCYSKIQNQSLNDEYYKKLLGILKTNSNIILFNDRINIKFKDIFKKFS